MSRFVVPQKSMPTKLATKQVSLIASGDLRLSANRVCWQAQADMESALYAAAKACGFEIIRAHSYDEDAGHGFIDSQKKGMDVFQNIDPHCKLIVAEAVWQYSHHVLAGLISHKGPILTIANWSGQWPGLVGMLNLNGSLTKSGVEYSTLWADDFSDEKFIAQLNLWLSEGKVEHSLEHAQSLDAISIPSELDELGQQLAAHLRHQKAIMGVFDEGCMGMFNAIIPDHLLNPTGVYKERLSQSALYAASLEVTDAEANEVYQWILKAGMKFNFGQDEETELTEAQVLIQCKMYIAAVRIAHEFGCDLIGIQYQQGLKDLMPASDLVEGMLNDSNRPPVTAENDSNQVLFQDESIVHFNEVDQCAGLDGLLIKRVHTAMQQPVENTLHDLRWGDWDASGTTDQYVWVFEISGSVPPSHLIDGYAGAVGERQPPMYFRLGGSTIKGISKPGEIVWSRIYVQDGLLKLDIGRAEVIELPVEETQRRWDSTTPQWPIMHAVTYGVSRDQMMAKHQSNHVQVVYANNESDADDALLARAAMARELGLQVVVCGSRKSGKAW